MEVEGRKDAKRKQKMEEEERKSRRKRLMSLKKKKDKNIKEIVPESETCQKLEGIVRSSSDKFISLGGEGAVLKSTGSDSNMYFMDGTRADNSGQFSTVLRTSLDCDVVD